MDDARKIRVERWQRNGSAFAVGTGPISPRSARIGLLLRLAVRQETRAPMLSLCPS